MMVWMIGQASGQAPAWVEGSVEVPFWIPAALLGVIVGAALMRLAWRASAAPGPDR